MRLVRATDKGILYKSHGVVFFCWGWAFTADISVTSVGFAQQRQALPAILIWDYLFPSAGLYLVIFDYPPRIYTFFARSC